MISCESTVHISDLVAATFPPFSSLPQLPKYQTLPDPTFKRMQHHHCHISIGNSQHPVHTTRAWFSFSQARCVVVVVVGSWDHFTTWSPDGIGFCNWTSTPDEITFQHHGKWRSEKKIRQNHKKTKVTFYFVFLFLQNCKLSIIGVLVCIFFLVHVHCTVSIGCDGHQVYHWLFMMDQIMQLRYSMTTRNKAM